MFSKASSFNQPLNDWDVSNVQDIREMFSKASSFNQPLNDWNVSNVQNTYCMLNEAKSFNQPLDRWDVSNAKDMAYMFCEAISFRQPITAWRPHGSTKGMFLRLPDYCDMESRIMCLTPLDEEAMEFDLDALIKIFGEEAVHDALRLYGPKYGLKED
ncbi:MAG: DUF285 domain-containing protein, partial [Bacteroides sp.]|nr:DUF285 domain-containing protein [Bacteroides sp.]